MPRRTPLESTLEVTLQTAVKGAGGLSFKLPAILYRGIPDRLVLLPGARVFFVELKADKGKPSVHQIRFRQILCSLGFTCLIIEGPTDLQEFIQRHVLAT